MDEDAGPTNRASGMQLLGPVLIAGGAAVLGLGLPSVLERGEQMNTLKAAWTAGGSSANSLAVDAFFIGTFAGFASIVAGIISLVSYFMKNRIAAIVAIVIAIIASVAQLMGGVLISQLVDRSFSVLEPHPYVEPFDNEQTVLIDFASAVFNTCCFAPNIIDPIIPDRMKNDTQKTILACPEDADLDPFSVPVCNPIPELISNIFKDASTKLCTCFQLATYNKLLNHIEQNQVCEKLLDVEVPVGETLEIPVVGVTVQAALEFDDLYKQYLPVTNFAMNGPVPPRNPAQISDGEGGLQLSPRDQGEEGWNCGLGYAKGVAWIQNMYIEQTAGDAPNVYIAASVIEIVACIAVMVFWCIGGGSGDGELLEYTDAYVPSKPVVAAPDISKADA